MKGVNKNLFRQFGQWTPFRFQQDLDSFLRILGLIQVFKGTGKKKLTDIGFWSVFRSENWIFYKNLLDGFLRIWIWIDTAINQLLTQN